MQVFFRHFWLASKFLFVGCLWFILGKRVRAANRLKVSRSSFGLMVAKIAGKEILSSRGDLGKLNGQRYCAESAHVSEGERQTYVTEISGWVDPPLISVVMPVFNSKEDFLRIAIDSIRNQIYPNWELCIADDASTVRQVKKILQEYAQIDQRIKLVLRSENGNICEATNDALSLASGDFIAFMDHDDMLPEHALYNVAKEIVARPELDFLFSDEDLIDAEGNLHGPTLKSDWNEELFLSQNFVNHLAVFRRSIVESIGGLRKGFEGSQDHDFVLRFLPHTNENRIKHIRKILYHWRSYSGSGSFSDSFLKKAEIARRRAVREYLDRHGKRNNVAVVEGLAGFNRICRALPTPMPKASIIIPTRDRANLLRQCVDSVFARTSYPNFEVIIVDNESVEESTFAFFEEAQDVYGVKILQHLEEFNYSKISNHAVRECAGSIVVLLNNDTKIISENWLTEMVAMAVEHNVGAVGAKLVYEDNTIQHCGVALGPGGVAGHVFSRRHADSIVAHCRIQLPQYVSAVTGACLVVEKEKYMQVGGLDEDNLRVAYNDVDFCLKLQAAGYKNVYMPYAKLYHFESQSRGYENTDEKRERFRQEKLFMQEKWGEMLSDDRYYNLEMMSF